MKYTQDFILTKIQQDNRWLERAILALYKLQTAEEKQLNDAKVFNRVGFSAAHASSLSRNAKWLLSGHHLDGQHLEKARRFTSHYVKQLMGIANAS